MMVQDWTMDQISAGLADDTIVLIDVREPHEFAMGHIPGSVSMPLSQFDPSALPADGARRIVLTCQAGIRSLHAIDIANKAGVPLDAHYLGGFRDWFMSGGAVARS